MPGHPEKTLGHPENESSTPSHDWTPPPFRSVSKGQGTDPCPFVPIITTPEHILQTTHHLVGGPVGRQAAKDRDQGVKMWVSTNLSASHATTLNLCILNCQYKAGMMITSIVNTYHSSSPKYWGEETSIPGTVVDSWR